MTGAHTHLKAAPKPPSENQELRDTVRVLGAVVEELAERVELLETRERVRNALKP